MTVEQSQVGVKRPHRSTGVGRGKMGVEAAVKALQAVPGVEVDPTGVILIPEAVVDLPARRFGPRVGTLIGALLCFGWATESRGDLVALAPVAEQLPQRLPGGCPSPRARLDSGNGAVAPHARNMNGLYREKELPPSPASGGEPGGRRYRSPDPAKAQSGLRVLPPEPAFAAMLAEAAAAAGITGIDTQEWWQRAKSMAMNRYDGLRWTDLTAQDLTHGLTVASRPGIGSVVVYGLTAAYNNVATRIAAAAKEQAKAEAQAKRAATPDGAPFRAPKPKGVILPERPERIAKAHWQAGIDIMLWRGRGKTPMTDILSVCRVIERARGEFDFGHLPVAMAEVQAQMMRDGIPRKFEQLAAEVLQEVINLTRKGPAKPAHASLPTQAPPPIPEAPSRAAQTPEPEPNTMPNTDTEDRVSWLLSTMPTGLMGSPDDSLLKAKADEPKPTTEVPVTAPKKPQASKNSAGKNAPQPQRPLFVGLPGAESNYPEIPDGCPSEAPDAASIADTAELQRNALQAKIASAKAELALAQRMAMKAARAKAEEEAHRIEETVVREDTTDDAQNLDEDDAMEVVDWQASQGVGQEPRTKAERKAAEARAMMRLPAFWSPCHEAIAKLPGILAFACSVAEHGGCPQLFYPATMETEVQAVFKAHGGRREATQAAAEELGKHRRILRGYIGLGCHANPCEQADVTRAA